MGKIKAWYRSIPIWLTIFLFAGAALIVCTLISNRVVNWAGLELAKIKVKYIASPSEFPKDDGTTYFSVKGELAEVVWYHMTVYVENEEDALKFELYRSISRYTPAVTYSVGLLAAVLFVYFSKLKKPLAMLLNASAKIAENQFDFSLNYSGHDEMARLCGAFEKMRSAVDENNMRMRQIIEERKQLNDAYTHDLRTPIAVL